MSGGEQEGGGGIELIDHQGDCHCGGVKFIVRAPKDVILQECNCSMCHRVGFLHLLVPKNRLIILQGEELLTHYKFNTMVADHMFCSTCGIKPFYIPRSNPDGFSINFRCVDSSTFNSFKIDPFDGINWEQSGASLAHFSKE